MPLSRLLGFTRLGLLTALVTAPASLHAQAQATTGVIRGVVSDSTGGPLTGAQVSLVNTETNAERVLTTNERGVFVATLLRVGTYNVTARALGFQASQRSGVALRLGETVDLPFALAPQAVQLQELTATAQEPAVDVTKSEGATRLGAEVVEGLPNNGRNIFNYTTLTPNVAIVQGPDGDEISVDGQKGIHNNVSVDGADFNNPFFGEQRGGQRPAFTFNLDAVQDFVVVADGRQRRVRPFERRLHQRHHQVRAPIDFHGSAHYFGKYDGLSADSANIPTDTTGSDSRLQPAPVRRHARRAAGPGQGVFLPGLRSAGVQRRPSRRPRARSIPRWWRGLTPLSAARCRTSSAPIERTNDANALLAKLDWHVSPEAQRHAQVQLHALEPGERHVRRGLLGPQRQRDRERSLPRRERQPDLASSRPPLSNEFRFQWAREDRPRPYSGRDQSRTPAVRSPTPTSTSLGGYRFGMPFFIPVRRPTTSGSSWWTTSPSSGATTCSSSAASSTGRASNQTFLGFANGRYIFNTVQGFLNYVANGPNYVECSDGSNNTDGHLPGRHGDHRAGQPVSPAGRRAAAHRRGGRNPDDHPARARGVPAGQLEAAAEPHPELRPPLGGADRARA